MIDPVFICLLCEQPIDAEEQADMVRQDYPDAADYIHADCAGDDDLYDEDDTIYPDPNDDDYFGPPDGWDDEEDW